jgi:hypothetical protein
LTTVAVPIGDFVVAATRETAVAEKVDSAECAELCLGLKPADVDNCADDA